ncbi:MAG: hypothetical protein PUD50_12050 [Eubacteriales bacterium]|nr:hypothetical protein [Eubacteriales bacterium]
MEKSAISSPPTAFYAQPYEDAKEMLLAEDLGISGGQEIGKQTTVFS